VNEELIPTSGNYEVKDTPLYFRSPAQIGLRINDRNQQYLCGKGNDHNWILRDCNGKVRIVAEFYE